MAFITFRQIKEKLRSKPDLNFIASVVTPWHTLGVEATLLWLQDNGFKPNGLCLVNSHYTFGFVCDETVFTNRVSEKYQLMPFSKTLKEKVMDKINLHKYVFHNARRDNDKPPFYIIATVCNSTFGSYVHEILSDRHVVYVIMEEGVGAYLDTVGPVIPKVDSLKSLYRFLNIKENILLSKYLVKHCEVINNSLFNVGKDGRLVKNERILPYYAEAIRIKAESTEVSSIQLNLSSSIIICTTAWERDKIRDDEDMRVLTNVCDYLHAKGHKLVLKPHPRDKFFAARASELHADILEASGSMESICALSRPKAIISFSSTALVTGRIFWNIPVFCLAEMLDKSKIGAFYLKESGNFEKVFAEFVDFPKTLEEITIE